MCITDPKNPYFACLPCKEASCSAAECRTMTIPNGRSSEGVVGLMASSNNFTATTPIGMLNIKSLSSTPSVTMMTPPLQPLFGAVRKDLTSLHHILLARDLPEIGADHSHVFDEISRRVSLPFALQITEQFQKLLSSDAQLTGFRASVVYPFQSDEQSWPILEWKEEDGINGMGVFEINKTLGDCSYILHFVGSGPNNIRESCECQPSVVWNVTEMSALKNLFQAARHALGVLKMPKSDAWDIFSREMEQNISSEGCASHIPIH